VVTPEPAQLAALGEGASTAVSELLERERVRVRTNARPQVPAKGHVRVASEGTTLEVGRIVALPSIEGRPLRNVPVACDGFVPVDEFSRVPDMAEHPFAAGDATNFPIKHGGLAAQQADVAAAVRVPRRSRRRARAAPSRSPRSAPHGPSCAVHHSSPA
jgi:sulfide:quinone oxidoreductase